MGEMSWKELRILYKLMLELAKKQRLAETLNELEKNVPQPRNAQTMIHLLREAIDTPKKPAVFDKKKDSFRSYAYALEAALTGAVEGETERWDEGRADVQKEIERILNGGKGSLQRIFCAENTTYSRSSWFEKMALLVSGREMPDVKMMIQACIGLHRTKNEATALMAMAGYNAVMPTQADEELLRGMNEVLQRKRYSAKLRNQVLFGEQRDITDELKDIGEVLCGALNRDKWMQTDEEKKAFRDLESRHRQNIENEICTHFCACRPGGLEEDDAFGLLESLNDCRLLVEIDGVKDVYKLRLEQMLRLCKALDFTQEAAAKLIEDAGYFKGSKAQDRPGAWVARENRHDALADDAFISSVQKKYDSAAMPDDNLGRERQQKIYDCLYQAIRRYGMADADLRRKIAAGVNKLDEAHAAKLLELFCEMRLNMKAENERREAARRLMDGHYLPSEKTMERMCAVMNGKEREEAEANRNAALDKYGERLKCLTDACIALEMTVGETEDLFRKAGYRERTPGEAAKEAADAAAYGEIMLMEIRRHPGTTLPLQEPDEKTVTQLFGALFRQAKEKKKTEQVKTELQNAAASFYVIAKEEALFDGLLGALHTHGLSGIPEGSTLYGVLKRADLDDGTFIPSGKAEKVTQEERK